MAGTPTTTETPNVAAGAVAGILTAIVIVVALFVVPVPPLTKEEEAFAFGAWLIKVGLLGIAVAFIFAIAGAFAAALAEKKTTPPPATGPAAASTGALDVLNELIGSTSDLVSKPAGIGAFVALLGAVIVFGKVFGS